MPLRRLVLVPLALLSCTGPAMAPYSPAAQQTDLAPEKLYAAAEGTLLDTGYLIERRDPAAHRLETKPRTLLGSEIDKDKYRYVWIVSTAGGKVELTLRCEHVDGDDVYDCGDERPEKLVREQDQLMESIVSEARGN